MVERILATNVILILTLFSTEERVIHYSIPPHVSVVWRLAPWVRVWTYLPPNSTAHSDLRRSTESKSLFTTPYLSSNLYQLRGLQNDITHKKDALITSTIKHRTDKLLLYFVSVFQSECITWWTTLNQPNNNSHKNNCLQSDAKRVEHPQKECSCWWICLLAITSGQFTTFFGPLKHATHRVTHVIRSEMHLSNCCYRITRQLSY